MANVILSKYRENESCNGHNYTTRIATREYITIYGIRVNVKTNLLPVIFEKVV